ncbi:class I SAM-dependent DNA methyltransferase [Rhizobium ruizarguesonis]|uniref:class I SAM-dependent DNA methyltransferase n=1 Tax=Rhizobium ruizarguesonis TaxID=2081791 RepID=UPI001AEE7377|nr:class I SAM-dependent DNA methyltransferase [Rhizobium ruizarguesonis]
MTPDQFIAKWKHSTLKERSASQSHFNDLCDVLGVDKPTDVDQKGDWYCFERGASKTAGGEGWADVWKRSHFGWEYKGKRKDLTAAFAQLQQYAVALENPPILVVSDMDRIVVHTNWTNTVSEVHMISLEELRDAGKRDLLRWVFTDPERLKPAKTIDALTREAADKFAGLAGQLHQRGHEPHEVAHFVNRLVFCMFAEDINLLPRHLFTQILDKAFHKPYIAKDLMEQLFGAMKSGGLFGVDEIEWFNGGLFDNATALSLTRDDLKIIGEAAALDWSDIDPSIFGTLFERGLDPAKRSQLGAHYTDPEKIMMIVRPVILEPLWREWQDTRAAIEKPRASEKRKRDLLGGFLERLRQFRVLDPACGSGNFLYLALLGLKDLEHRVNLEAEAMGFGRQFPTVGPQVVNGIEINPYAAELARVTVWIGEIQWMRKNGFDVDRKPVLKPLNNIECRDALINPDGTIADWPRVDAIIGNPPFLGDKKMIRELTESYVQSLRRLYGQVLPQAGDLVCFWFAKAWQMVEAGQLHRAGFVATNSIRSGSSNKILKVICDRGRIFDAWDDEPWVVDGAAVRVSLVSFDRGGDTPVKLDNKDVSAIHPNLTAGQNNVTRRTTLAENTGVCFVGVILNGSFEISGNQARNLLTRPLNVNGKPNSDVIRPTLNGDDFNGDRPDKWVIDFGTSISAADAALYERPFAFIEDNVKPYRQRLNSDGNFAVRAKNEREIWWRHARPRPKMRKSLAGLKQYVATPMVSSYRTFDYLPVSMLPDQKLVVFAREDDSFLGVLQSKVHHIWTIATCSWIGAGNDVTYSNTAVFETFPFPDGLTPAHSAKEWAADPRAQAIALAAKELKSLRDEWLHPTSLIRREPEVSAGYPERILPVDKEAAVELAQRTLGALYSAPPAWLKNAHAKLDQAVLLAYGWPINISDEDIVAKLLALNLARSSGAGSKPTSKPRQLPTLKSKPKALKKAKATEVSQNPASSSPITKAYSTS